MVDLIFCFKEELLVSLKLSTLYKVKKPLIDALIANKISQKCSLYRKSSMQIIQYNTQYFDF